MRLKAYFDIFFHNPLFLRLKLKASKSWDVDKYDKNVKIFNNRAAEDLRGRNQNGLDLLPLQGQEYGIQYQPLPLSSEAA